MTTTTIDPAGASPRRTPLARLWYRQLDHYPETGPRMVYLGIVVITTILLYYQLYIAGAVAPSILSHYGMTFRYYVDITVIANAFGAFSSLLAGLGDRWGRANMVTYGVMLTGLLVLFGLPNAPSKLWFAVILAAIGFVEGIILVATPALVRDFSPQLGRASAMGFWTLGPVVGSLCVAEVSSHTLPHLHAFQDQFVICGVVGLVVFAIALVGLRELSPGMRDQLMVSMRDRALIELRAKGLDISESLRRPWRQMLHVDIVGSAFAIAAFLIFYYTAVGFFTIYFTSVYGFTLSKANSIGNWLWATDAIALVVVGLLSDRVGVRKPFMVVGGVGAVVMTVLFLGRATHPTTSYGTLVAIVTILAVFLGIAFAPWMAGFTETVERRNPALTATGLAIWGWIVRAVVAISVFILPSVVTSATPLAQYGTQAAQYKALYPTQIAALGTIDPTTLAAIKANPLSPALNTAIGEVSSGLHVSKATALGDLVSITKLPIPVQDFLNAHGTELVNAQKVTPRQWQHWWWACVGGEIVFIPLIFLMAGRWSPATARRDAEEHETKVKAELAALAD